MRGVHAAYYHLRNRIKGAAGVPIRLDSESQLATRCGVSRWQARGVLQQLVREGFAVVKHGRGYFARSTSVHTEGDRTTLTVVYGPEGAEGAIESVNQERILAKLISGMRNLGFHVELLPIRGQRVTSQVRRMVDGTPADAYLIYSLTPALQAFFAGVRQPAVVYGATHDDLGLPSVALNLLEITRELTEQLFRSGHRCVCLLQEQNPNIGWERSRLGFEYAHSAWRIRFKRERIVRVDRPRYGLRPAIKQLLMLSPTGLLVQNAGLFERLWDRADHTFQAKLKSMEIIVLNPDYAGLLRHPAQILDSDAKALVRITTQLLINSLRGGPLRNRHLDLPWRLVNRP